MSSSVIQVHLHPRRTGVTRHVEDVTRALGCHAYGDTIDVPRLAFAELFKLIRERPVVWHAHRNNELMLGVQLRPFAKRMKIVFTRHSATEPGAYSKWLMAKADRVLSLDEFPHGVDLARFTAPPQREWAPLGQGGEHGIGVIGRIRPDKGQQDFAAAVKPVPPSWRAVVIGLAKDSAFLESLGLTHIEETAQIERWYRGLTVVVQPSHEESFGLVLVEAMASGCCVVAAELPHYRALLEHGRTGFFYPVGDVEALRAVLRPLLEDPSKAVNVGKAAAEEASRRFGIEHEAAALTKVYEQLLA